MFQFLEDQSLPVVLLVILGFQFTRYFLIAGGTFALFWGLFRRKNQDRKIDPKPVSLTDIRREISWSFLTFLIFLVPAFLIVKGRREGWLHLDSGPVSDFGVPQFLALVLTMLALHDFYFYWIHRWMHSQFLYRWFHEVHHRSLNPTPWAAFSFHPLEALLESAVVYVFIFILPMHAAAIFVFQLLSLLMNVYGHLGYDITPRGWRDHWVLRWVNTTRNHHWHHQRFNGNYGLYTTLWDRLFGTYRELAEVGSFQGARGSLN
jgi:lathosterol oxidase